MLFSLNNKIQSQRGAALLAFVLVMIVGSSFLLVSKLNAKVRDRENIEKTYDALQRAKEALIAYAVSVPERTGATTLRGPGYLPCPDNNDDGQTNNLGCGNLSTGGAVGWLPYKTLEIEELQDGSGEHLWYVVADNYRNTGALPVNPNHNSDTISDDQAIANIDGPFVVDNNINGPDIVAIIFSPGAALPGQNRILGVNDYTAYLDSVNSDGNDRNFISFLPGDDGTNFNDRILVITRQELMKAVEKRVLNEATSALRYYRIDPDRDDQNINGVDDDGDNNFFDDDPNCLIAPFNCDDVYGLPWLKPFDPTTADVNSLGVINTTFGQLPVFVDNTVYNIASVNFDASWSGLPAAGFVGPNPADPNVSCLTDSNCIETYYCSTNDFPLNCGVNIIPPPAGFPINSPMTAGALGVNNINCVWNSAINAGRNTFNCSSDISSTTICINDNTGTCYDNFVRTYSITYTDDGSNVNYIPPTAAAHLRRNLSINGNFPNQLTIQITDVGTINPNPPVQLGQSTLTVQGVVPFPPTTTMNINNLDHHIDTLGIDIDGDSSYSSVGESPPVLPTWFVANNWHHMVYVAYPVLVVEPLPGSINSAFPPSAICVPGAGGNCLNLTSNGLNQINDNRVLLMIAGQDLTPAVAPNPTARPNTTFTDYFESIGGLGNLNFDKQLLSNSYNDQINIMLNTTQP